MHRLSAVIVLLLALAGASVAHAERPEAREAKARELFAVGNYAGALEIYGKLYAETTHPTYMRNIGRCYQNMGEPDKAISSFREYLRQAKDLPADQRGQVEGYIREMEELKRGGAMKTQPPARPSPNTPPLTTTPPPPTTTPPPPAPPPSPVPMAVPPAMGAVPASATSPQPASAVPGLSQTAAPPTGETGSRKTAAYVVGGIGAGALVVGGIFGWRAISKRRESNSHCPTEDSCTEEAVTLNEEAKTAARVSDVAFGAGLVGVAVAAYLLVTSGGDATTATPGGPAPAPAPAIHVAPAIGPTQAGLTLGGSW